jgi:centrin-1
LGLSNRNPYVLNIVWALREQNKILNFDDFVEVVCQKTGDCRSKDGIKRVFDLYDKEQKGEIGFEQFKDIIKFIGENMTDDDILELMHSVFITKNTQSNETFTFE